MGHWMEPSKGNKNLRIAMATLLLKYGCAHAVGGRGVAVVVFGNGDIVVVMMLLAFLFYLANKLVQATARSVKCNYCH